MAKLGFLKGSDRREITEGEDIYSLIQREPTFKDRLLAQLTRFRQFIDRLKSTADMELEMAIGEFNDCLSFFVIPAAFELERRVDQRWNRLWMCIEEIGLYAYSLLFDDI
ncbi:hypothetical protein Lser_V15G15757 [Lactuca serriola]